MCTLIVLHRCIPGTPLAVGANRDEFFERPTEGPALRKTDFGAIVAPRDLRAGGTWLGLNEHGLFAAVTNRPAAEPDPQRRSRGLLVVDALRARSAEEAIKKLEDLAIEAYNPFNLLVADREQAHAITYERAPRRVAFGPGPIVIGNADPTAPPTPKLSRLKLQVQRSSGTCVEAPLEALAAICRSHEGGADSFRDTCVHAGHYGTRSSTLLRLGDAFEDCELRHSDGAPCVSEYRDYTPLLHELNGSPRETQARGAPLETNR
jgi:uncharacterized protein with NRDE domain